MVNFCITVYKSLTKDLAYLSRSRPHFLRPEPETRFKAITLVQQCNHDTCREICFYTVLFYLKSWLEQRALCGLQMQKSHFFQ